MGLYFVNISLVGDPELDPGRPEIVIDKPLPNGRLRLIGADFLVLANAWDALHRPAAADHLHNHSSACGSVCSLTARSQCPASFEKTNWYL